MYSLKIYGFNTKAEVEAFVDWYNGQGEQDAYIWLEVSKSRGEIGVDTMNVDYKKASGWDGDQYILGITPR